MAAQDCAELIPRVRRALEGPIPQEAGPTRLSDDQVEALAADAIADIILLSAGKWPHQLIVSVRDPDSNYPTHWQVDPELTPEEESVVAAQAAIGYFFQWVKDFKSSEKITNEGQAWEYSTSSTLVLAQLKLLQEQRDAALEALVRVYPVLARYASILVVRDRIGAALLEPWTTPGGLGGGMYLDAGPIA